MRVATALPRLVAQSTRSAYCPTARVLLVFDSTSPVKARRSFARASNRGRQGYYGAEWLDEFDRQLQRQEVVVLLWRRSHTGSPINEAADVAAAEAAVAGTRREVPRGDCRFASLRFSRQRKGVRAWAAPRADAEVMKRLRAAVVHTQFREKHDVHLPRMSGALEQAAENVRAARVLPGDRPDLMPAWRRERVAALGCPRGCKGADGSPAPATWWHAQFVCRHDEAVRARRAWVGKLCEVCELAQQERPHDQVIEVLQFARAGLPEEKVTEGWRALGVGAELSVGDPREALVRRAVGGLVRSTGSKKLDKTPEMAAAMAAAVEAGLLLQTAAVAASVELSAKLTEEARARRLGTKYGAMWRRAVVGGGARRAAVLAEAARAAAAARRYSERARAALAERRDVGLGEATAALDRAHRKLDALIAMRRGALRRAAPRTGPDPISALRLGVQLRRWRWRAACRLRGPDAVGVAPWQRCAEAELLVEEAFTEWRPGGGATVWVEVADAGEAGGQAGRGSGRLAEELRTARRALLRASAIGRARKAAASKRVAPAGGRVTQARVRRARQEDDAAAGETPYRRGFWAAKGVLGVRAWHGLRSYEALVEWEGLDPDTGAAWESSWVHTRQLSTALRNAAVAVWGQTPRAAAPVFRERPAGARKSPRLAETLECDASPTRARVWKRLKKGPAGD